MIAEAMPGTVREDAAAYAEEPLRDTMTILMVEPGKYPRQMEIGTELADLQKAVGGDIEVVYPFEDQAGLVMNEEGKINGLPLNRALRDEWGEICDVVAGPFMVVGLTEESFGSLSPQQMQMYGDMFHQPEVFMKMGRSIMAIPLPDEKVDKTGREADKTSEKAAQKAEKAEKNNTRRRKSPEHDGR